MAAQTLELDYDEDATVAEVTLGERRVQGFMSVDEAETSTTRPTPKQGQIYNSPRISMLFNTHPVWGSVRMYLDFDVENPTNMPTLLIKWHRLTINGIDYSGSARADLTSDYREVAIYSHRMVRSSGPDHMPTPASIKMNLSMLKQVSRHVLTRPETRAAWFALGRAELRHAAELKRQALDQATVEFHEAEERVHQFGW